MKNLRIIIIMLLAVCALQACRHGVPTTGNNDDDTSSNEPDTSATLNLAIDKNDSTFAITAANGGLAEVEMGKLAIKNGKSKKVKNFGAMMVKDHGRANVKLMAVAKAMNLALPDTLDTASKKMIADLSKKSGEAFDKAYISSMIADHEDDVKEFAEATKKIQDPNLKIFAKKILPVLQKHLDAINAIHDSME